MPTSNTNRPQPLSPTDLSHLAETSAWMTPAGRRKALSDRSLSISDLNSWATHCPEEVPLIDGEVPWIALSLADNEN